MTPSELTELKALARKSWLPVTLCGVCCCGLAYFSALSQPDAFTSYTYLSMPQGSPVLESDVAESTGNAHVTLRQDVVEIATSSENRASAQQAAEMHAESVIEKFGATPLCPPERRQCELIKEGGVITFTYGRTPAEWGQMGFFIGIFASMLLAVGKEAATHLFRESIR